MAFFTVAGRSDCKFFIHALYVANCLSDSLPNFKVHIIKKGPEKWEAWLKAVNEKFKWSHYESPITWKTIPGIADAPFLIGGISEFWEYCYDYYGLSTVLNNELVNSLRKDYIQYFTRNQEIEKGPKKTRVFIIGNEIRFLVSLVGELISLKEILENSILNVKVYIEAKYPWEDVPQDLSELTHFSGRSSTSITIVNNIEDGLKQSDLLILTGDYTRDPGEELQDWLWRNSRYIENLSQQICTFAKRNLKVIVATTGPVCYHANVLVETATRIQIHNIVAVTADIGLQILNTVCNAADIDLGDIGAPPVWGFVGLNHIIDIEHIVEHHVISKPIEGALVNAAQTDVRFMHYHTRNISNIWLTAYYRKQYMERILCRKTYLAKLRATISLIKTWYSKTSNKIMCLGILSNGSFQIPEGVVFSQPAILKDECWTPVSDFPTPRSDPFNIEDLFPLATEYMCAYNLYNC